MPATTRPFPSATVVLLRDALPRHGAEGFEMLLLQRASKLAFHGGAWVFPGGRIDPADYPPGGDVEAAARRAAVRETHEEAGLEISAADLVDFARWTTPEGMPKRFVTWFFMALARDGEVRVDGGEIKHHRWMSPASALRERAAGTLELPPPTFVTTTLLSAFADARSAVDGFAAHGRREFVPRMARIEDGVCSLYQEDAGYADADAACAGPRHRLWMTKSEWRYERAL